MIFRTFLATMAMSWLSLSACRAASELNKPYDVQIVLHVADNRLLTDVFRERVGRDLRDGLQAALGEVARVSVTAEHPRLKDVLKLGLDRGLDSWAERDGIKTHFVLIDFSGVYYEIQARQHDGNTGRASRIVRRDRTRDRDFVARAAALMVARDFGLIGTIVTPPDGQESVKVELKGGALGSLARWVRKGQIFEIVSPGGTAALEWALLQVTDPPADGSPPLEGTCICRLWHRYKLGNVVGHHCMVLGTTQAPLRIRFVQERGEAASTLAVEVRRFGFRGEDTTKLTTSTDGSGWLDTSRAGDKGIFDGLAFVSVTRGLPGTLPQIPVAIMDDRPIVVPVTGGGSDGGLFITRRATWERSVSESVLMQVSLFKEIQDLAAKPEGRLKALERARLGLQRSKDDLATLHGEREELAAEAKKAGVPFNPALQDQRLKDLQEAEKSLKAFLGEQESIERDENDPRKKEWRSQIERGKLLEKDLDIGKALGIYEAVEKQMVAAKEDTTELSKHIRELREVWKTASEEHKDARGFIFNVWPTLDTAGLKARMAEARKAFEACQKAGDILGPRKLFLAAQVHADRLRKEAGELNPKINIDDEKPAKIIEEVSAGLVQLASDIQVYLKKKAD